MRILIAAIAVLSWAAIAFFVSFLGYIGYEIFKDSTSTEIPKTVEGRVDLKSVTGETYLPEDIKYFSVRDTEGMGWVIEYRYTSPYHVEKRWSFALDHPGKGLTFYDPLPDSFRIENNLFLFTWEHRTGGLVPRIAMMVFLNIIVIIAGVLITSRYLKK